MLSTLFLLNHGPQKWEYVYVKFHNSASEILTPLLYLFSGFKSSLKMKFEKFNTHITPMVAGNNYQSLPFVFPYISFLNINPLQ